MLSEQSEKIVLFPLTVPAHPQCDRLCAAISVHRARTTIGFVKATEIAGSLPGSQMSVPETVWMISETRYSGAITSRGR